MSRYTEPMTDPLFSQASRHIVRVALPVPVDSLFSYCVPDSQSEAIQPGQRVLVPFSGRRLTGIVVESLDGEGRPEHTGTEGLSAATSAPRIHATIEEILDPEPTLSSPMLQLLREAAADALCPIGLALAAALPPGSTRRPIRKFAPSPRGFEALRSGVARGSALEILRRVAEAPADAPALARRVANADDAIKTLLNDGLLRTIEGLREPRTRVSRERFAKIADGLDVDAVCEDSLARAPKQAELLRRLSQLGEMMTRELGLRTSAGPAQLRALVSRGFVEVFERETPRNVLGPAIDREVAPELSTDQEKALSPILRCIGERRARSFLLHGVTGSGKTEVYLRAISAALDQGRQALVLVPEITLTHQIVARLRARFGDDLAVLHSGLRPAERLEQWQRLGEGNTPIAVGARSAVFAPLTKIGVIVVDEEHDSAYKNEEGFRYHARRLAEGLSSHFACPVILGSATPALETRYRAESGEIERRVLPRRIGGRPLPSVEIVNLEVERQRTRRGRKLILSNPLRRGLEETLAESAQSIVFLNRRGFSTQIFCFDCGFAERCMDCDVALVYHATEHCLRCHYCDFTKSPPQACGGCGNPDTALLGIGTERVEEEIRAILPGARTARLDRDTAQRRGHVASVLSALRAGEIDILIGTQMVAKGHDFPGVRLVGVVAADLGLHMPDFRASERCFQLLTQVAGRAGRAHLPGRVILQSFVPDHYAIRCARKHDYETFYREEIGHRRALGYPPFGRITQIIVTGEELEATQKAAEELVAAVRADPPESAGEETSEWEVLGPVPAPFARLRGRHRLQIVIKGTSQPAVLALSARFAAAGRGMRGDIQVMVDVDPVNML